MIGPEAEDVLNRAVRYAFEQHHEYFTLEHVLLSLLEEAEILDTVQACGASYIDLKRDLEDHLEKEVPSTDRKGRVDIPPEFGNHRDFSRPSQEPREEDDEDFEAIDHPVATLSIQRLIQRALFHVQSAGKDEIQPIDLFVALFQSKDSFAVALLKKHRVERLDVLNYVSHGGGEDGSEAGDLDEEGKGRAAPKKSKARETLKNFTTFLNARAEKGKIDPLIGRENELERMIQTLCRRQKNNPLLVGEAGVGKTALAEGIAMRVVEGKIPSILQDAEVYALDLGALLAGAKFRGDFEQRLKMVFKGLRERLEEGKKPIVLIDEIHTLVGAGAVNGGAMDAANFLKPILTQGEIQVIGSTTYNEYRNVFEKDAALARRFQKIDVSEPSVEEAIQILEGLKERYQDFHNVSYSPEALRAAVELSAKHLSGRFLPDKAVDVMDEAGARARIERMKTAKKTSAEEKPTLIDEKQMEEVVAKIARIPTRSVSTTQRTRLKNLERDLKLSIFGQDHAIQALVTSIQLARSGLRSGERPVGSFLFTGPTGVGKTELSKQLAHCLGVPFHRFDMSEYMEKHTVSRLIGAPPGYVGFEQAGLLTDALLKNPHSVVLLDEMEKAHMDLWNILLQVMDHGTLTDHNGRKVDFRNCILIMTSNVGSREHERRPLGMGAGHNVAQASKSEVERTFSPEFRNRLDSIIYFNPLDPVTIAQVVGKQLMELENQLLAKNVEVSMDSDVREWLGQKGYDVKMGARPMARLIQDRIKKPLAEEILFGKLENGGKVEITLDKKGEPQFSIKTNQAPSPSKSKNSKTSKRAPAKRKKKAETVSGVKKEK